MEKHKRVYAGSPLWNMAFILLVLSGPQLCLGLLCHCNETGAIPRPNCLDNSFTCQAGFACYTERFVSPELDSNGQEVINMRWGCLGTELESSLLLLESFCDENLYSDSWMVKCCNNTDKCNADLKLKLPVEGNPPPTPLPTFSTAQGLARGHVIAISVSLATAVVLAVTLLAILCRLYFRRRRDRPARAQVHCIQKQRVVDCEVTLTYTDNTSGSMGPLLKHCSLASSVQFGDCVGKGRRSRVFAGRFRGEMVAVKKFSPKHEHSWFRETEIYNTLLLHQDSVLVFLNSDRVSCNGGTEFWLVTQYHPHGSLYDYLGNRDPLAPRTMLQMAVSTCSGLAHLHMEMLGGQVKRAVAHGNITSKNVLVKNDLTCCISDFGQAVIKDSGGNGVNLPVVPQHRCGVRRYLAPEFLAGTVNLEYFESYKQADVYALGLVLWEVCRRCSDDTGQCEDYEVPFQGLVPPDPSFEEMRRLVVVEKRQPTIPTRWHNDELLQKMGRILQECWHGNSSVRPTAVYLKKKLVKFTGETKAHCFNDGYGPK